MRLGAADVLLIVRRLELTANHRDDGVGEPKVVAFEASEDLP